MQVIFSIPLADCSEVKKLLSGVLDARLGSSEIHHKE